MPKLSALPAFTDNYIWCYENSVGESLVVDPGDAAPVLQAIENGLRIAAIFITHHHPDHIGGISQILAKQPVPVYGPSDVRIPQITQIVKHGDCIQIPGFSAFTVWHVPGHTLTHITFHNEELIFCGDTLFSLGCGRLFEGTPEQMFQSLQLIQSLPDATQICCTHEYTEDNARFALAVEPNNRVRDEYVAEIAERRRNNRSSLPSSIGIEKNCNPFLRVHGEADLLGLQNHLGFLPNTALKRFSALRAWKNTF